MPITTIDNCETLLWNGLTLTLQKKIEHYDAKVDNVDLIQRIDYINLNCTTYEMIDVNEYVKKSEMPITFGDIIKEIVKIKVLEESEIKEIELNEEIIPVIFNKDEENETTNYMVGNGMYVFVENESGEDYYIFYELVSETSDVDFREYRFSLME